MDATVKRQRIVNVIKKICSYLWYAAVVLLFIVMVAVFATKISGKVPGVFGYSVVNIVSGSMKDEINAGEYILLKQVDPADVKKGDIICFYSIDPDIYGMPNTHRVVEPPIETENGFEFVTQGDANLKRDDYHALGDRLVGKYVGKLDGLNALANFAENKGIYALVITLVLASFAMILFANFRLAKRRQR